jgi:hypothetical protein
MSEDETTRLQAIRDELSGRVKAHIAYCEFDRQQPCDCPEQALRVDILAALEAQASVLEAATMREQLALSLFRAEQAAKASAEAQVDALTRAQADKTLLRDWRWQDEALQRIYGMAQDALGIEPPHVIVPDDVADLVERAFNAERLTVDALTATLRALEAKWRKEVAGGWRNGVVIAIERCADDLAVLLDERGSR